MIDTGMNRLGLRPTEIDVLDGLDDRHAAQPPRLRRRGQRDERACSWSASARCARPLPARRYSIANSAGICLGRDYSFDLVRPGLSLYGGIPRAEAEGNIRQVARVEAQIVQRRTIPEGESCGYGAHLRRRGGHRGRDPQHRLCRRLSARLLLARLGLRGEFALPVLGRVSMDLIAVGCDAAPDLKEGDWVEIDYDLPSASKQSGLSQYELLTCLGDRFERRWV